MQTAAGQDAVFCLQRVGRLRVVPAEEVYGDNAHPPGKVACTAQADVGGVLQPLQKAAAQRHFVLPQRRDACLLHEAQRRLPAVIAGEVGGAGFEFIRQIVRQIFTVRGAAGAAGGQGREPLRQLVPQQQRTGAAGPQQSLVPRHGQRTEVQRRKVDGQVPRRLRRVQRKGYAAIGADPADGLRVLHGAADIGAVRHDDQLCVVPQQTRQGGYVREALAVAGQAADGHLRQPQQGTHDGVVLHAADDAVVAGSQKPGDQRVQGKGGARREYDVGGRLREAEQPRQTLPQRQRHQPGLLRGGVDRAVHVGSYAVQIVFHPVADALRLGKGRGGVVEIDGVHGAPPCVPGHHTTKFTACHGVDRAGQVLYNSSAILEKK